MNVDRPHEIVHRMPVATATQNRRTRWIRLTDAEEAYLRDKTVEEREAWLHAMPYGKYLSRLMREPS